MLYRIITEDKNTEVVCGIIGSVFEGYTKYTGVGYWKGERENCLIIEIDGDESICPAIVSLCKRIKEVNVQEAVLLQSIECRGELI